MGNSRLSQPRAGWLLAATPVMVILPVTILQWHRIVTAPMVRPD